ncbi:unnamed protein product [Closterium sp. NIES-54]
MMPMVIVLEKELAALSIRPGDDVKPFLDKIKDTYARMAAAGSKKSKAKVTFGPTSCRAKLGKLLLWDLEEKNSCIKYLWHLPIIPWNWKPPATAAAAASAKTTVEVETAPIDGALDAVKKVQQPQQSHGEVLAGVDGLAAWAKASSGSGEADWETWHARLYHINIPMLQKLVKDGSLNGLEVKGGAKEIGSCPTCLETKESGHKVKVIRTDNGGEFIGTDFERELERKGIEHQLTLPYNPRQNGMAERFNRTLQEGCPCEEQGVGDYGGQAGFQQTKGKDFHEIFATVGKGTTLRVSLATAANCRWRIKQMDITTAFLNGIIMEELYMQQPEGLDDGSGRVCRLKKAIYGLKQAPCAWYHKLEEILLAGGFKKSECDHSMFLLQEKEKLLMLLVYVADTLLFSESSAMIERVEEMLEMQFKKYCEGLAENYGLQDGGKPATPMPWWFTMEPYADEEVVGESDRKLFHSMVGALNYVANHTRPDIAFATSRLASVVSCPSHEQLEAAKKLVRYVSATASVGLEYSAVRQRQQRGAADLGKGAMLLNCYTNASFNSVKADGTRIGGYVCLFGGGAVSWRSKKQNEMGMSSYEIEYMALHHGASEVVWLRHLLEEIGFEQKDPIVIFYDNESAVKLAKNACLHELTKHIRPRWHWVRRLLDKEVRLEIVKTQQQAADIFTKRLAEPEHWKGMKIAGMSVN